MSRLAEERPATSARKPPQPPKSVSVVWLIVVLSIIAALGYWAFYRVH